MTSDIRQSDANRQEQLWLQQLQQALIEDRENEDCQADPIYYGIQQMVKQYNSYEYGCIDGIDIYDSNAAETMSLQEFFDELPTGVKASLADDSDDTGISRIYVIDGKRFTADTVPHPIPKNRVLNYEITNQCDFTEYLHDTMFDDPQWDHLSVHSYEYRADIAEDIMFLTRKEADAYLKKHGYNHSKDAHSWAMTAERSPSYEHLLKLLKQIDFSKSTIILKNA